MAHAASVRAPMRIAPAKPTVEPDYQTAIRYVARVKARYQHDRRRYDEFLFIMRQYRDGHKSRHEVCEEVASLFVDSADLVQDFSIFLPDQDQPALFVAASAAQLGGLRVS